jgi:proteasome activator subunit 4
MCELLRLSPISFPSCEFASTDQADRRPEIFALRDMNDNQDLQRISGRLLAMITSITPSLELIEPLMDALVSILQSAEVSCLDPYRVKLIIQSWRTKVHCMPVLSLVYYRNLSLLSESCKARALDVVALCLRDPNQEVREIASAYVFIAVLTTPADHSEL